MKFSVTIPAYKSKFLDEAIQSVINQTYENWELIVVDDCSPEELHSIVAPYLKDNRVRYYRNEKNCGAVNVVDNWNICLSYCTGDYVICIGDDDRLLPCCLNEYSHLIQKYPTLNVYHTWTQIIDDKSTLVNLQSLRPEWESALSLIWNRWDNRHKQFLGDFCYRVDYLKKVGGYYKQPLAWGSDDITAVMAAKEKGIANTQTFGFQYRESSATISQNSKNSDLKVKATLTHYNWFTQFLAEISKKHLSPQDCDYLSTIETPRREFFMSIFGIYCSDSIKGNPMKLLRYYKRLKPLHFPKAVFIKWYLISIYKLI